MILLSTFRNIFTKCHCILKWDTNYYLNTLLIYAWLSFLKYILLKIGILYDYCLSPNETGFSSLFNVLQKNVYLFLALFHCSFVLRTQSSMGSCRRATQMQCNEVTVHCNFCKFTRNNGALHIQGCHWNTCISRDATKYIYMKRSPPIFDWSCKSVYLSLALE